MVKRTSIVSPVIEMKCSFSVRGEVGGAGVRGRGGGVGGGWRRR